MKAEWDEDQSLDTRPVGWWEDYKSNIEDLAYIVVFVASSWFVYYVLTQAVNG